MSEAEPIPPTSSVTALRIPMIKKGEYDLWSMKMRQYIAITDHILWDIITNGDQATTDPASSSAPKTSLAANARRNNEKALNILLSAIPDRHLLSFHDAVDARTLWNEITIFEQKPHESLFEAWERYKLSIDRCPDHNMLLVTQIDTFYNGLTLSHQDTINAAAGGTFMQKTPEECYELIENMTTHHNHWDTLAT
ncbi:hypothetical protein Tco_0152201 [Tanacetum coccineum]